MVSDQAHYCIDKAVRVMGWGDQGIILIPTGEDFSMDTAALDGHLTIAKRNGLKVIAVVGSACSTATGSFDDLQAISAFCQKHDLWFHVDGAHGAATIYSTEFCDRVAGIELADSITMDFHKLLMTPALATAVVFKDGRDAAQNFAQKADYLWNDANQEDNWHDLARRTFECTKSMVAFKVFTILAMYGESIFDKNVTTLYRSATSFADLIMAEADFELATRPQSNIVCFRYTPPDWGLELNELNQAVRAKLISDGDFYIVQTMLGDTAWLRCTVANPFTNREYFEQLLNSIRQIANTVANPIR
jgi:L-2,4-diaminobutyrate decarboxylase